MTSGDSVGATDEQAALLLAPGLATTATVVVDRGVEIEDLGPELLRHTVPVHHKGSIGPREAAVKHLRGSYFRLARRD